VRTEITTALSSRGRYYRIDRADGSEPSLVLARQIQPGHPQQSLRTAVRALHGVEDSNDKALEILFLWLSGLSRNRRESTVQRASAATGLPEKRIKDVFRRLQDVGLGRYVRGGRNGHMPRFQWAYPVFDTAAEFLGRG